MKAIKFTGIALTAMLISTGLKAQTTVQNATVTNVDQALTIPLSEPGKPYKLNVDLTTGSIKIVAYEGRDVVVLVTPTEQRRREDRETRSGMHRITGGLSMDVTGHEKNNEVDISSDRPSEQIMLTIKIPQGATSIKLRTVNGGDITANNISGQLEASNTNGSINLTGISGSVVANTTNGEVKVTLKSIDPKAPMAFTSLNGNVDVTFPATLRANVKVRADRGEVYTAFDMAADPSKPKTTKTAKDGMYSLSIEDWVTGKIGGGGPEMMMKTFNGNIFIRKAK